MFAGLDLRGLRNGTGATPGQDAPPREVRRALGAHSGLPDRLRAMRVTIADRSAGLDETALMALLWDAAVEIEELEILFNAVTKRRTKEASVVLEGEKAGALVSAIARFVPQGADRNELLRLAADLAGERDTLAQLSKAGQFCEAQKAAVAKTPAGVPLCAADAGCTYCNAVRQAGMLARELRDVRADNGNVMGPRELLANAALTDLLTKLTFLAPKTSSALVARAVVRSLRAVRVKTSRDTAVDGITYIARVAVTAGKTSPWVELSATMDAERAKESEASEAEELRGRLAALIERGDLDTLRDLDEYVNELDGREL